MAGSGCVVGGVFNRREHRGKQNLHPRIRWAGCDGLRSSKVNRFEALALMTRVYEVWGGGHDPGRQGQGAGRFCSDVGKRRQHALHGLDIAPVRRGRQGQVGELDRLAACSIVRSVHHWATAPSQTGLTQSSLADQTSRVIAATTCFDLWCSGPQFALPDNDTRTDCAVLGISDIAQPAFRRVCRPGVRSSGEILQGRAGRMKLGYLRVRFSSSSACSGLRRQPQVVRGSHL